MLRTDEKSPSRSITIPARAVAGIERAKRKFLRKFPGGFRDETYLAWERDYKWAAHLEWEEHLNLRAFGAKLRAGLYKDIADRAVKIESGRSLLFSFEKMALRDAVRQEDGAKRFSEGLFALLHGRGPLEQRFIDWVATVDQLPRKQTRVLTWPLVTVFGFIAQPERHMFLKPITTREAARKIALPFAEDVNAPNPKYGVEDALWSLALQSMRELSQEPGVIVMAIESYQDPQGSDEGSSWADRAEKYVASKGLRLVVLRPRIGSRQTNQVYFAVDGKEAFPGSKKTGFLPLKEMSISKLDQVIAMKNSGGRGSTQLAPGTLRSR